MRFAVVYSCSNITEYNQETRTSSTVLCHTFYGERKRASREFWACVEAGPHAHS